MIRTLQPSQPQKMGLLIRPTLFGCKAESKQWFCSAKASTRRKSIESCFWSDVRCHPTQRSGEFPNVGHIVTKVSVCAMLFKRHIGPTAREKLLFIPVSQLATQQRSILVYSGDRQNPCIIALPLAGKSVAGVGLAVTGCRTVWAQDGRRVFQQCSGFDRKEVNCVSLPFPDSCAAAFATLRRCCLSQKERRKVSRPSTSGKNSNLQSQLRASSWSQPARHESAPNEKESASSTSGRRSSETMVDEPPPAKWPAGPSRAKVFSRRMGISCRRLRRKTRFNIFAACYGLARWRVRKAWQGHSSRCSTTPCRQRLRKNCWLATSGHLRITPSGLGSIT